MEEEECFAFSIIFSGGETGDLAVSFAPGQDTATCCIQDNDGEIIISYIDSFKCRGYGEK